MPHANPITGATVYLDDNGTGDGNVAVPEDTLTSDGWPGAIRFVGPGDTFGSGVVLDIDSDA